VEAGVVVFSGCIVPELAAGVVVLAVLLLSASEQPVKHKSDAAAKICRVIFIL
jgi:hypothetical protein